TTTRTFFDANVSIGAEPGTLPPGCTAARPDHPNLEQGSALIRLWPAVFTQFQRLISAVLPFLDSRRSSGTPASWRSVPGEIRVAVVSTPADHPVIFAESLVHELAHHKLLALGVPLLGGPAARFIKNPPEQQFKTPFGTSRARPMHAVLHDLYACTYVTELDLRILDAQQQSDRAVGLVQRSLMENLPRLEIGVGVVRDGAMFDEAGRGFFEGLSKWI